jgi:hypothetical protein
VAGRPWIKLHTRWLTSPAHAHLSGEVLGIGLIVMILIADQGEDDDKGGRWLTRRAPLDARSSKDLVGSWLKVGRMRVDRGRDAVQSLVDCGSFAVRLRVDHGSVVGGSRVDHGSINWDDVAAFGAPNWLKWQEHPSSKRVRKHRAQGVTVTGEEEAEEEGEVDVDQRAEKMARADSIRTTTSTTSADYALLKEWSVYGNDPAGLGRWPDTETPSGVKVRRLVPTAKLADMVAPGKYTAAEVHEAVHGLAAMVKAGAFPASEYTPSYVFSGYFAGCLQRLGEWQAEQKRKAEEAAQAELSRPAELTAEEKANLVF